MNQRVDDYISHEPDWANVVADADFHCGDCDGVQVFDEYDSIERMIKVRCKDCGATERISRAREE